MAGKKDSDIIVREYLCRKRVSKKNATQSWTCLLISKRTEQGLQSEDIEKRRQEATLLGRSLGRESLWALPVHLHHSLRVVIHHANPSAELRLESGSLQNSRQKHMGPRLSKTLDWSHLISADLVPPFNSSRISRTKSSVHSGVLLRPDRIADSKLRPGLKSLTLC